MTLTKEELEVYKNKLKELKNDGDLESAHVDADGILCEIITKLTGNNEIEELFNNIEKWYA